MNFNAGQIEQIRLSVLRHLIEAAASTRFGVPTAALLQKVRSEGYSALDEARMTFELEYMMSVGMIVEVPKVMNSQIRNWRISDEGKFFFEQQQS